MLGHIFGGLVADAGNGGNTGSSGRIFEVTLTPVLPPPADLKIAAQPPVVNLELSPSPGVAYLLESSPDLLHWSAASAPRDGGATTLTWSLEEDSETHFYRVISGTKSLP